MASVVVMHGSSNRQPPSAVTTCPVIRSQFRSYQSPSVLCGNWYATGRRSMETPLVPSSSTGRRVQTRRQETHRTGDDSSDWCLFRLHHVRIREADS